MKKHLALILAAAMVMVLVPMTALAAEHTVPYDSTKTAQQNGDAFFNTVMSAADGDTIMVPAGRYYLTDGQTSRITGKSVTIIGAGASDSGTVFEGAKYGLVLQNDDLNNRATITIKDMKIVSNHDWAHPIYAKNNITVNLENLVLSNNGTTAILLDSSNLINEQSYDGVDTIVHAKNVTIDAGDKVEINACPCSTTSTGHLTYGHFYFEECTNISADICQPQGVNIGYDNAFVNGVSINPDPDATPTPAPTPIPEEAPIPETGDGMGLFVAAGLMLAAMLGMVTLRKREQY